MAKMKSKKYVYWTEDKYLFYLPILYWNYFCDCCDNRRLEIKKKGFIKIKTIKHKRPYTIFDRLVEDQISLMEKGMIDFITKPIVHWSRFKNTNLKFKK